MNTRGFTLIEVMIAVMILAVLSTFTAQTVIRSMRDKARLQKEIDLSSQMQNALRLIERDVNTAFHYRDVNQEIEKAIKEAQKNAAANGGSPGGTTATPTGTATGPGGTTPPVGGATTGNTTGASVQLDFEPKDYKNFTQFIGDEKSMNFTSLSHIRTMQDSLESDQQEVGYYIESCKNKNKENSKCLWRRSTPYIDEDVTKGGNSAILLDNVSEFKLRYFGEGKLDWVADWKTDDRGDAVTKDHFPQAVELTLSVKDGKKESTLSTVIPIYYPANKSKDEDNPAPPSGSGTSGGQNKTGTTPPGGGGGST